MSMFTIANLGDAALSVATQQVTGTSTISSGGVAFVANNTGFGITVTVDQGVGITFLCIKDMLGNANTTPITILSSSGLIDGNPTYVIALAYGWVWLSDNGTGFSIIG